LNKLLVKAAVGSTSAPVSNNFLLEIMSMVTISKDRSVKSQEAIVNNFSKNIYLHVLFFAIGFSELSAAKVGLFYALDADLTAVQSVSEVWIHRRATGATVTEFRIGDHEGVAIQMGSGSVQTAMSTMQLLFGYRIDLAISVGPAGNLGSHETGEVVRVSRGVAFQKSGEQDLDLKLPPMGWGVLEELPEVVLASGEEFINRESRREALAGETGAAAVDMNLFGLAHVLSHFQIPGVHLRIISDHADDRARADFLEFVDHYDGELGRHVVEYLENLEPDPTAPDSYEALKELGLEAVER